MGYGCCSLACRNPTKERLEAVLADTFKMGEEGYARKFTKAGEPAAGMD
jgi:hypothetical protein